jgi:AraC-like DNA-binding protein
MELTFVNIALIVAASQSFLLSVLIFQKHRALFANRFLAALMLSYTLILLHILFQDAGVYAKIPILYILVGVTLAASQLQYLYTKYLLNQSKEFTRIDWIHFVPFFVVESILAISILFGFIDFSDVFIASPTTTPFIFRLFNWILIVQGIAYMTAGIRLIVRYNKHLKDVLSSIEEIQMNWLRNITIAGMSAWILFFIEDLFLTQGINLSNFVFVSVVFAIYVYTMGFFGLIKSEIFANPVVEKTMHVVEAIETTLEENNVTKYERSGLSDETAKQYLQSLLQLMNEKKIYLNSSLTLTELSEELSISPHNLSEVINTRLRKNFYDFINSYRIDQVKKDLADPSKQHLKILSIAFDAGFNSKATFNTLFKEQIGKTPSEYRKNILQAIGEE